MSDLVENEKYRIVGKDFSIEIEADDFRYDNEELELFKDLLCIAVFKEWSYIVKIK